jgi:hypothetical protein
MAEADEVRAPDIVLAEISRKYVRERAEGSRVRSRLETITSASIINPVGVEVAMKHSSNLQKRPLVEDKEPQACSMQSFWLQRASMTQRS